MKTKPKTLIFRALNVLLTLAFLIMLFAYAKPKSIEGNNNINGKHATSKFRPILDSTILCQYETWWGYETNYFYIVEDMPRPKIPTYEIENILKKDIRFNTEELSYNDTIGFQCVVNCMGKAGDFQILKCPDEFVNIGCQVLNVLRMQLTDWEPPVQRDENVNLLALIAVVINNGQFEVVAPVY